MYIFLDNMNRNLRHFLNLLLLLVCIAAPLAAIARAPISSISSGAVEDRVIKLERILNAHSQLLIQFQQQLSGNKAEIDYLRGQIQESLYKLNQLVEQRHKHILLQIDNFGGTAVLPAAAASIL